jgi:hypothetical protein
MPEYVLMMSILGGMVQRHLENLGNRFILFTSCPSPSLLFLYSARWIFLFYEEPYAYSTFFIHSTLNLEPVFIGFHGLFTYKDTKAFVNVTHYFGKKFRGITCLTPPPPSGSFHKMSKLMCAVSSLYFI